MVLHNGVTSFIAAFLKTWHRAGSGRATCVFLESVTVAAVLARGGQVLKNAAMKDVTPPGCPYCEMRDDDQDVVMRDDLVVFMQSRRHQGANCRAARQRIDAREHRQRGECIQPCGGLGQPLPGIPQARGDGGLAELAERVMGVCGGLEPARG